MQYNKPSASSPEVSFRQVFAMFKDINPSESNIEALLYIIGIILTPVTLFGMLWGLQESLYGHVIT